MEFPQDTKKVMPDKAEIPQHPPQQVSSPSIPNSAVDSRQLAKSLIAPDTPEKFEKKVILKSRFFYDQQQVGLLFTRTSLFLANQSHL